MAKDGPRDGDSTPDRADDGIEHTRPFDPVTGEGAEADRPTEQTERQPELDATTAHQPVDRTQPVERTSQFSAASDPWSGRAEVSPPRPSQQPAPAEWDEEIDQSPRRWWMPILIGLVALLLLAVLGFGIWLIMGSAGGPAPVEPSRSPSASPTSASPSPSTAPPSSASAEPSPTEAETVQVPPVVGLPEAAARGLLDQFGLTYALEFRSSDQPPGTVIDVTPEVGTEVAPGEQVVLIIAEARPTPPAPTEPTEVPTPTPTSTR